LKSKAIRVAAQLHQSLKAIVTTSDETGTLTFRGEAG
jgi:hypothetical protein